VVAVAACPPGAPWAALAVRAGGYAAQRSPGRAEHELTLRLPQQRRRMGCGRSTAAKRNAMQRPPTAPRRPTADRPFPLSPFTFNPRSDRTGNSRHFIGPICFNEANEALNLKHAGPNRKQHAESRSLVR
jgi:hypothetical protein